MQSLRKKLLEKMSEEELADKLEKKREQYAGLLNHEGALYAVAREEGLKEEEEFTVEQVYPKKQFAEGRHYSSLILSGEQGRTRLVFWNQDADKASEYAPGDRVSVSGARKKTGRYGPEMHYTSQTSLRKLSASKPAPQEGLTVRVTRVFPRRFFQKGVVRTAVVNAGGEEKRLVMWNDLAFSPVSQHSLALVSGAVEKEGELHAGPRARITLLPVPPDKSVRRKVAGLVPGQPAEIRAVVTQVTGVRSVSYCPKHNSTKCECEKKHDSLVLSFILSDQTGDVRAVAFFDTAEDLLGITGQELARAQNAYDTARDKILGEEKVFYGVPRQAGDGLELVVRGFYDYDLEKELEVL